MMKLLNVNADGPTSGQIRYVIYTNGRFFPFKDAKYHSPKGYI